MGGVHLSSPRVCKCQACQIETAQCGRRHTLGSAHADPKQGTEDGKPGCNYPAVQRVLREYYNKSQAQLLAKLYKTWPRPGGVARSSHASSACAAAAQQLRSRHQVVCAAPPYLPRQARTLFARARWAAKQEGR
eukprot:351555-Chlamydomonas_euryale.AAC.1